MKIHKKFYLPLFSSNIKFLSIFVKTFTSLLSQLIFSDQLVKHWTFSEKWLVRKPGAPTIHNKFVCVKTYVISKLKGTHWVSSSKLHCEIYIFGRGVSSLNKSDSFH